MLGKIRELSSSIVIKVLLGLLVLAFIFTGASSFIGGGSLRNEVATIGDSAIGLETYTRAVQQRVRAGGSDVNVKSVKAAVINELIQKYLFVELGRDIGLSVSEDVVVKQIKELSFFQGEDGNFDRNVYKRVLREVGLTEAALVDEIRQDTIVRMMMDPIRSVAHASEEELDVLYKYYNEMRTVALVEVPDSQISNELTPTDAQLQSYYEQNSYKFQVPELRSVEYIVLDCNKTKLLEITEEAVKERYDSMLSLGEFQVPEQRNLQQLLFSDRETAEKALEQLKNGVDIIKVANELLSESAEDIEVSGITKDSLLNELKTPVFTLDEGGTTEILETPLGFHIFKLVSIEEPKTESFETVKDNLEVTMRELENCKKAEEIFTNFEDEFAGGASLQEVISLHPYLALGAVSSIDQTGNNISGNAMNIALSEDSMLNQDLRSQFLEQAFALTESGEAMTYIPLDNLFIAFQVTNIAEPRLRSLDEIKGTLIKDWQNHQNSVATLEYLRTLEKHINNNVTSLDAFAQKHNLKVEIIDVKRVNDPFMGHRPFPQQFLHEVFKRKKEQVTSAYRTRANSFVIAVLKDIKPAEENSYIRAQMKQGLESGWYESAMYYYAKSLQNRFPVSVNKNIVDVNL